MPDAPAIIARKLANALVPGARPAPLARVLSGPVLELYRKGYGGLWVGGSVTLTARELAFAPNGINRAVHAGVSDISVPLQRVASVSDRFGLLTRIIDVRLDDGTTFTFRCFGAPAFARRIQAAAARLGRDT